MSSQEIKSDATTSSPSQLITPELVIQRTKSVESPSVKPALVGRSFQRYTKQGQRRLVVGGVPFRIRVEAPVQIADTSQVNFVHLLSTSNPTTHSSSVPPTTTTGLISESKTPTVKLSSQRIFLDMLAVGASRGDEWILPKGGWESFETLEQGAKREVEEEAGVETTIESYLGVNDGCYNTKGKKPTPFRMISFWMRTTSVFTTYAEAHRARRWFCLEDLCQLVVRPPQVAILKRAFETPQMRAYVFVESLGYLIHGGYPSPSVQPDPLNLVTYPVPQTPSTPTPVFSNSMPSPTTPSLQDSEDTYEILAAVPSIPEQLAVISFQPIQIDAEQQRQLDELLLQLEQGYYSLPCLDFSDISRETLLRAYALSSARIAHAMQHVTSILSTTDTPELRPFSDLEIEQ